VRHLNDEAAVSSILRAVVELPRLAIALSLRPVRLAVRRPQPHPESQTEFARQVSQSLKHQIRAGYTHRFIDLMFVTVGERVFCRRYTFGEPSWHGAFLANPEGQVRLDKTVVNVEARVPTDLDEINPAVDEAYAEALKTLGATYLLAGATEPRAHASTLELVLAA